MSCGGREVVSCEGEKVHTACVHFNKHTHDECNKLLVVFRKTEHVVLTHLLEGFTFFGLIVKTLVDVAEDCPKLGIESKTLQKFLHLFVGKDKVDCLQLVDDAYKGGYAFARICHKKLLFLIISRIHHKINYKIRRKRGENTKISGFCAVSARTHALPRPC